MKDHPSNNIGYLKRLMVLLAHVPYMNHWLILLGDVCISIFASMLAILINESVLHSSFPRRYAAMLLVAALFASLFSFIIWRTHKGIIRHSTLQSIWRIIIAVFTKEIFLLGVLLLIPLKTSIEQTTFVLISDMLFTFFLLLFFRVGLITAYQLVIRNMHSSKHKVLLYNSGGAQNPEFPTLLNLNHNSNYSIAGYISFNTSNHTYQVGNLPAYSVQNLDELHKLIKQEEIEGFIFTSKADLLVERERLIDYSVKHRLNLFTVPPIDKWNSGTKVRAHAVSIEDLLGRDEIIINTSLVHENLKNKTVLVTGAAGSIGSELCRQIARVGVGKLILLDFCETGIHNLRLELEETFPNLVFAPVIGDVRASRRVDFVFRKFNPNIVFHAAAYKHVPLMETNPCEAIRVNAIGTRYVADAAIRYKSEKFIMISTDKAVNPTSVMGASKRLAEIYVQGLDRAVTNGSINGVTRFITTRFGNVLGSQGSVIPRFKAQIDVGGPITVTHPKITRYFMTIKEACLLVLEASTIGSGGEIMVFDMGTPIRIADLANRMITLAGYTPGEDIKIVYTGLRPGEKLYEEVLNNAETTQPTPHEKIRIATVREYEYKIIAEQLDRLKGFALDVDVEATISLTKQIIPEYVSNNSEFEKLDTKR